MSPAPERAYSAEIAIPEAMPLVITAGIGDPCAASRASWAQAPKNRY